MKRHIRLWTAIIGWSLCVPIHAQSVAPPAADSVSVATLLQAVEAEGEYRVVSLADPAMRVALPAQAPSSPLPRLRTALAPTPYRVSLYEGCVYILPGHELITELPSTLVPRTQSAGERADLGSLNVEEPERATSENKLYYVGDPSAGTPSRVKLRGRVTNFKTGEAMIGATLVLKGTTTATSSDVKGNFTLELPAGRQVIEISGVNIHPTRRQLMLYGDGAIDIELEEESHELEGITILAERIQNVRNTQLGMVSLRPATLKNVPMVLGELDVLRIVQSLPGVKTVGEASSGYNVRGGATDQNLILLNDGTIYNPNHLFGFFAAFNSDMVQTAEIYKSSIPAQYGGRISSVLEITSREANKREFKGSAGIGAITSNLSLEIPIVRDRTSLLLSGRTTYSDWILGMLPEKSGYKNGKAGFYDMSAVFSQKINVRNSLNLYAYHSHDRFSFSKAEKYGYNNLNLSARWRSIFSDRFYATFAAGYDHYDYHNRDRTYAENGFELKFRIEQYFAKADFSLEPSPHNRLRFGAKSTRYDIMPGQYSPSGGESQAIADKLQHEKAVETALYLSDEWDITSKLALSAGIRYSLYTALGPRTYFRYQKGMLPYESTVEDTVRVGAGKRIKTYHGPEFRLSARYAFTDHFSVKAGFNSMRQYIHKLSNTVIMSPTDTWKLSDANIKPQRGWQAAAGLYYTSRDGNWEYSLEGYYKSMADYLDYRSGARLIMNHHIETDVITTEGKAYGGEFQIRKYGRLNGWVSYTYARTFLRQSDQRIASPVNAGAWYPTEYDKPHDLKLTANYKITHRFSVSLNVEYNTGRPTTVPAGQYWDERLQSLHVFYTDRNAYRIPDYFRTDFSINLEPSHYLRKLTHSSISVGVYNLTGRKNVYSIYFLSEQGRIQGYKLSIFGAPIPFITYNLKF